jgi:hypothetical protein
MSALDTLLKTPVTCPPSKIGNGACHIEAHPNIERAADIEPSFAPSVSELANRVLAALPPDAPYVTPRHIAPLLGIEQNAFTYHCRNCKATKNWRGDYRFQMDDPEHVEALRAVVKLVLWSGRKLPPALRSHYAKQLPK